MRFRTSICAVFVMVSVRSSSLFAVPINVPNYSFEADQSFHVDANVSNWTFQSDGGSGTNDRDPVSYPLSTGALPGGSGQWIGFFNQFLSGQVAQAFTQDVLHQADNSVLIAAPNVTYTMTVALGNVANFAANYNTPGHYRLQILTNFHEVLASFEVDPTPGTGTSGGILDGQLKDYTLTYTSPATATGIDAFGNHIADLNNLYDGGHVFLLQVQVVATGDTQQSSFDDVRFDASPVPEPTSLTAVAVSGMGAFGLRRRRGH